MGYKVLTNILADRIGNWVEKEEIIKESQAGFRRKRGARNHVFVLNFLINGRLKEKRGKLYVGFIDLKAAFDTVDRELLLEKLWNVGIKGRLYAMIKEIYKLTSAEVVENGKVSRKFNTNVGVRQGCAFGAILFDIFLDDIDDEWAIVAESASELQKMLKSLQTFTEKNKLKVNTKKTKVMVFKNGGKSSKGEKWTFEGEDIEVVNQFKYLGYTLMSKTAQDGM